MWGINIRNKFEYTHTYTHYLRWTLFHFLCMCKRTYDTMLCATLLLAINYCHFLLRMASDIVIRLPGFRLVFLIWNECAKSLQDSKFPTKNSLQLIQKFFSHWTTKWSIQYIQLLYTHKKNLKINGMTINSKFTKLEAQ